MEDELKQLKSTLRSLVVSSPTQVNVRSLLRDYRNMLGSHIPLAKFGYKDPITFLRERFSDCFLFQGPPANPELTLIVPDALKHVDKFVQKQKVSVKHKYKRRSVPESAMAPSPDLIVNGFKSKQAASKKSEPVCTQNTENEQHYQKSFTNKRENNRQNLQNKDMNVSATARETCRPKALDNVLKKRSPMYGDADGNKDDDSGRQTSSTSSSSKRSQLEVLKREVRDMILDHPNGVWCTDLLRLYRARHGRELNFIRFGYTSVLSLASDVSGLTIARHPPSGDWLLSDARRPPPPPPGGGPCAPPPPPPEPDPDDALPGIPYEADVYPADGIHFLESIPGPALEDVAPGALLEVLVAEVYSPSHFWLQRLGQQHNIAMEDMMDDMNRYYNDGEGKDRRLAPGAVRVGHYCSSRFEGDWHRSLIVQILDCDTVKVRHVDYGTVERMATRELRVLRLEWAALEAQAVRARLAGVRPPAAGRRWPRAAAHRFLALVRERRLVASVVAADARDSALEVLLVDTATDEDVCIGTELVRAGHADPRPDSALGTAECYLYPRFDALENGATPNFAEIHVYLRDGIQLEFVKDYRRHVPPGLPPCGPGRYRPESCGLERYRPESCGPDPCGPERYRREPCGPERYRPDSCDPERYRPDSCGPERYRPESCGPERYRPDSCGPEPCGPERCRPESCGHEPCGPEHYRPDSCGPEPCGPERCRPDSCGSEPCGPERYRPDSCGPEPCGPERYRSESCRHEPCGPERYRPDSCGPERYRPDSCGPERYRPDSCGPEPCGPERYRPESCGHEPCGPEHYRPEPCGSEPCGPERYRPESCGHEPCGPERYRPEPCGSEPCGPERYRPDSCGTERYRPESCGPEHYRPDSCGTERYRPESCGPEPCGPERYRPEPRSPEPCSSAPGNFEPGNFEPGSPAPDSGNRSPGADGSSDLTSESDDAGAAPGVPLFAFDAPAPSRPGTPPAPPRPLAPRAAVALVPHTVAPLPPPAAAAVTATSPAATPSAAVAAAAAPAVAATVAAPAARVLSPPQAAFPQAYATLAYAAPVSLSASEVEAFALLSRVDLVAAHRFMVDAVSRAVAGPRYWALAGEPSLPFVPYPSRADYRAAIRPPPGFENF